MYGHIAEINSKKEKAFKGGSVPPLALPGFPGYFRKWRKRKWKE